MKYNIKIRNKKHLIEWLRFIQDSRPKYRISKSDICTFDFVGADFLQPFHLSSLSCLIEEYKKQGAKICFKLHRETKAGKFLMYTKFNSYWKVGFDRNFCLSNNSYNTIPIWQYNPEKIDEYANVIEKFYSSHSLKGKDLTPLRISIVEALNNINDHSESQVSGFIFTQFYNNNSMLEISICDFGTGIPKKVNKYLIANNAKKESDISALEKALKMGFSTKSKPHNAGKGLDNILSNINASKGELQIISNKAFYFKALNTDTQKESKDNIALNFRGTYLNIKLDTKNFQNLQEELNEEIDIF